MPNELFFMLLCQMVEISQNSQFFFKKYSYVNLFVFKVLITYFSNFMEQKYLQKVTAIFHSVRLLFVELWGLNVFFSFSCAIAEVSCQSTRWKTKIMKSEIRYYSVKTRFGLIISMNDDCDLDCILAKLNCTRASFRSQNGISISLKIVRIS